MPPVKVWAPPSTWLAALVRVELDGTLPDFTLSVEREIVPDGVVVPPATFFAKFDRVADDVSVANNVKRYVVPPPPGNDGDVTVPMNVRDPASTFRASLVMVPALVKAPEKIRVKVVLRTMIPLSFRVP